MKTVMKTDLDRLYTEARCQGQRGFDERPAEDRRPFCSGCPVREDCISVGLSTPTASMTPYADLTVDEMRALAAKRAGGRPSALSPEQQAEAVRLYRSGVVSHEVAARYGVSPSLVRRLAQEAA